MKITNHLGLPPALLKCILHEDYERGESDYSVTELMSPARKEALAITHNASMTEDASDRIYAFMGKVGHAVFEKARIDGDVVEHRLYAKILGKTISGKFDRLTADGSLIDAKFMSVYEMIFGLREERIWQLNAYAYLAEQNGIKVSALRVLAIFRDWSVGEAERRQLRGDKDYPQQQVSYIEVPRKTEDEIHKYLKDRIKAHNDAREKTTWLPECTPEERWEKPTMYALMKPSRKSALRVMEDRDALMEWAVNNSLADQIPNKGGSFEIKLRSTVYIEARLGESTRCARYCNALPVCKQGQKIVEALASAQAVKAQANQTEAA
jgi:hypothetical protein